MIVSLLPLKWLPTAIELRFNNLVKAMEMLAAERVGDQPIEHRKSGDAYAVSWYRGMIVTYPSL